VGPGPSDPMDGGHLMSERCHGTSKQTGRRCGRAAIPGGRVCKFHGGAAPQVKRAAALRLLGLVDPALARLALLIKSQHAPTALAACRDVLDRAGLKAVDCHEGTGADGGAVQTIEVRFVEGVPK
jgi:hypothetical protein